MSDEVIVTEDADAERFDATISGRPAGHVGYRVADGRMTIPHTEVDPAFGGKGVGSRLAVAALDAARERGLAVVPQCPFITKYIERHPEYAELVA
jgi:predicted GNAT family acetyltransferase